MRGEELCNVLFFLHQSPRSLSLEESNPHEELASIHSPDNKVLYNGMSSPVPGRDTTTSLDDIQTNQYSIEIETLLVANKLNGGLSPQDAPSAPSQLLVQLCKIRQISDVQKVYATSQLLL